MIKFKTFRKQIASLTGAINLEKQEQLRQEVADFVNEQLATAVVINITETLMTGGMFLVTVWYKVDETQPAVEPIGHQRLQIHEQTLLPEQHLAEALDLDDVIAEMAVR